MFEKVALSLLATTAVVYGRIVPPEVKESFQPKFDETELVNAPRAKVFSHCVNPGQVAFTFDDGPQPEVTNKVLDFLKENNIIGTFFINAENGHNLNTEPEAVEAVKRADREGHVIGSHTYYHHDLFEAIPKGEMEINIDTMNDKIKEILGKTPKFFRPPLGNGGYSHQEDDPEKAMMNEKIQKYLGASGQDIIMWGADTRDWEFKTDLESEINYLNKDMKRNETISPENSSFIILMHDIYPSTAELTLPKVYEYVTGLGYKVVSLLECIGYQSGYQEVIVQSDDVSYLNANRTVNETINGTINENDNGNNTNQTSTDRSVSAGSSIETTMAFTVLALILTIFFLFE